MIIENNNKIFFPALCSVFSTACGQACASLTQCLNRSESADSCVTRFTDCVKKLAGPNARACAGTCLW